MLILRHVFFRRWLWTSQNIQTTRRKRTLFQSQVGRELLIKAAANDWIGQGLCGDILITGEWDLKHFFPALFACGVYFYRVRLEREDDLCILDGFVLVQYLNHILRIKRLLSDRLSSKLSRPILNISLDLHLITLSNNNLILLRVLLTVNFLLLDCVWECGDVGVGCCGSPLFFWECGCLDLGVVEVERGFLVLFLGWLE